MVSFPVMWSSNRGRSQRARTLRIAWCGARWPARQVGRGAATRPVAATPVAPASVCRMMTEGSGLVRGGHAGRRPSPIAAERLDGVASAGARTPLTCAGGARRGEGGPEISGGGQHQPLVTGWVRRGSSVGPRRARGLKHQSAAPKRCAAAPREGDHGPLAARQ